jgi:hypothetical protein
MFPAKRTWAAILLYSGIAEEYPSKKYCQKTQENTLQTPFPSHPVLV